MGILIQEGGITLAAIAASGIGAVAVFIERLVFLHKARIHYGDFLSGIFNILEKGKVREAIALCDEVPGPVARLVHSAVMHRDESRESLRMIMENAGRAEIARMERRLTVLSTIIQTAPLLGLLGGLLGVLRTVLALRAEIPVVQALDLTGGLVQALVNAVAGLAVAIPAYAMFSILVVRIDRIVLDMEQATADILAVMPRMATVAAEPAPGTPAGEGADAEEGKAADAGAEES